jgi:hypothetical protein
MPSVFEYHFDGKLSGWSDLGEDECPWCGLPLVEDSRDEIPVPTKNCSFCGIRGKDEWKE